MAIDAAKLRMSIPFFREIEPALLERIVPLMFVKKLRKGEIIFLEGDDGDEIYFIGSGAVSIYTFDKAKKVTLAFLREGEYFGEMALLKPGLVRSATAETLMATRLYALRRVDFQTLIEQDRNLAFHLLDYTMERLRRANQQIYDLTFLNVRTRIIKRLLYLSEEYGGSRIPVKITHQQLADMVGAVRETVSKVLQDLQDKGLIEIRDKMIRLTDPQTLERSLLED
ncbi:cyclic nucleotide-binding domain-containing protein [Cohnella sp. CFH 77786]|uniref:Crp/Fnr family transcriptional regulator n=1 Tax=Cohnella sp. CFH 77786 TaxID=2662265 RepID=UPI001C60AED8|nr:Crp/Fnr family transcriptional regulator [Cohnella sp. CFH 77786]MBW5447819.1 cyclic nucleotide-binding domain-containing protein [Cohnella sp. CFH 77786]